MNPQEGVAETAIACTGSDVAASVAADPLADRFEVETYKDGDMDITGDTVQVASFGELVTVTRMRTPAVEKRGLSLSRAQAIELRDALSVLIENTKQNTGE